MPDVAFFEISWPLSFDTSGVDYGVQGTDHSDVLDASDGVTDGPDSVFGHGGRDWIYGLGGDDVLIGGEGDDILSGGTGADYINGGEGRDTASYYDSSVGVLVHLDFGEGDGGTAEGDTLVSIENLEGSLHDDFLFGDGGANLLTGHAGSDFLWGGDGTDTLFGGNHDDTLKGGGGADDLNGGNGNDTYYVDSSGDTVNEIGGQGSDTVYTSVSWTLTDGADVETLRTTDASGLAALNLIGNSNGNEIIGNDGSNIISGGGGADQMYGRDGSDTYYVDHINDTVTEYGGDGIDMVWSDVSWTLTAAADVEYLWAFGAAWEVIDLTGNSTGNIVTGHAGSNVLNGGGGNDELTGLGGQDFFLFDTTLDGTFDVITDFDVADDTIRLDDDIFSSALGLGSVAGSQFVIGTAATDANHRIIYNDATGDLLYDSDGTGATAAIQFARVEGGPALTNFDFFVVA